MNPIRISNARRTLSLSSLLILLIPLFPALVTGQQEGSKPDPGAYVHEKAHYTIVLPKGFEAWTDDQVKALYPDPASNPNIPEDKRDAAAQIQASIIRSVFQPRGANISNQTVKITFGHPARFKSADEFAAAYTSGQQDVKIHSKETLTIDYRPSYLVDWEFTRESIPFRQLMVFVTGMGPMGYLLTFSCVSADFDEYRGRYMKSLKSFKVTPPTDVAPELLQKRYTQRGAVPRKEETASWRSTEVICSVIVIGIVVLWFVIRGLIRGAAEQQSAALPGQDAPPAGDEGAPPPSEKPTSDQGADKG
jgi:hypothetical protein